MVENLKYEAYVLPKPQNLALNPTALTLNPKPLSHKPTYLEGQPKPQAYVLGRAGDLVSKVISRVIIGVTPFRALITLLITYLLTAPPSKP